MRPVRSIPRPQFGYEPSRPRVRTCGRCGEEYIQVGTSLHHVQENGSGEIDKELDLDHRPVVGDYHAEE